MMGRPIESAQFTKIIGFLFFIYIIYLGHETVSGEVVISEPKTSRTVNEWETVRACCTASCLNGTCSYSWALTNPVKGVKYDGPCVTIEQAKRSMNDVAWNFQCTVLDQGDDRSGLCEISIQVQYPPDVTIKRVNDHLECTAKGYPDTYTFGNWTHTVSGVVVRTTSGEKNGNSSLRLALHSTYEDFGDYDCLVHNGVVDMKGVIWQKQRQHVNPRAIPTILTPTLFTQNVSKGETFSTQIDVFSALTRNYSLTLTKIGAHVNVDVNNVTNVYLEYDEHIDVDYVEHNLVQTDVMVSFYGKTVNVTGTQIYLTIAPMEETYFGHYNITIGNDAGKVYLAVHINPQGPPDTPIEFAVTDTTHDSAYFHVTSGFYNGGNQTLVIEYRLNEIGSQWKSGPEINVGSERNQSVSMRVEGLEPSSQYVFRAYSFNEFNRSRDVESLYIETESDPLTMLLIGSGAAAICLIAIIIITIVIVTKRRKKNRGHNLQPIPQLTLNDILMADQDHTDSNGGLVYENTEVIVDRQQEGNLYENTQRYVRESFEVDHPLVNTYITPTSLPKSPKTVMEPTDDSVIYLNTNQMAQDVLAAKGQSSAADDTRDSSYTNVIVKTQKPRAKVTTVVEDEEDYIDMELNSTLKHLKVSGPTKTSSVLRSKTFSYAQDIKSSFDKITKKSKTKNRPMEEDTQEPTEMYIEFNGEACESVPDYPAPPPPSAHLVTSPYDYVNTRHIGKQSF